MSTLRIQRTDVISGSVRSIGYDRDTKTLDVQLASHKVLRFYGVPYEVARDLYRAESVTDYFERHVRRKFPSVDLETLDEHEGSTVD